MPRNRIWVNFSKEYTEEYFNAVKEDNFSKLVCKLLREYYIKNKTTDDYIYNKLEEISDLLKDILDNNIKISTNKEEELEESGDDFEIW